MSRSAAKPLTAKQFANTVKPYRRHLVVCTGKKTWKTRIEKGGGLLGRMASEVGRINSDSKHRTLITATDEPTSGDGFDVLAYPDGIRYPNVGRKSWRELLAGERSAALHGRPIEGRYVFVCTHGNRDERCGECGPPIMEALERACARAGVVDVKVRASSHVGGHKFAGNVIVYPGGVWYGGVRPADAARIVEEHLVDGRIVENLLRGKMEDV